jgi:ACS family pantothenate transporter-like MFS transporter
MNGFQYAVAAWLPILIFPQLEAPTFRKGFPATFGFVIAAIICIVIIQWFAVRERKMKASTYPTIEEPQTDEKDTGSGVDEKIVLEDNFAAPK